MKKREADLLDNGLLLAAVCLDINSMEMLPVDSAEKAIQTITILALRIQGLDEDDFKQIITDDDDAMSSSSEDSATDSDEEMRVLRKKQRGTCASFSFSRSVEVAAGRSGNTKGPDVKQQTITGVKVAIEKLMNQRMTLKKTKKDLLTLINEDYPKEPCSCAPCL